MGIHAIGSADGAVVVLQPAAGRGRGGLFGISAVSGRIEVEDLPSGLEAARAWGARAGAFAGELREHRPGDFAIDLADRHLDEPQLRQILAGLIAGLGGADAAEGAALGIRSTCDTDRFAELADDELAIRRGVELAVSLTDARANQLDPAGFADIAQRVAAEAGLGCRVTRADELREAGFGALTAIGQGSERPPVMVELWHSGSGDAGEAPPRGALAFAGKGITFDSGGLSLKPANSSYGMHTDCAGAATVLGAFVALARTGVNAPLHAALPLAENIPGPGSIRPGDVVTARNGMGVEIVDTDFEGRVVLADAVSLLSEHEPAAVVTLATLTMQVVVALGPEIAGLMARDDALAGAVLTAAERSGEALWRLPWAERYAARLRSTAPGAELRNHPLNDTGRALTAALFIGRFAPPEVPFAHIDFAGPAVATTADGPAATGYGVRTLVELARGWESVV